MPKRTFLRLAAMFLSVVGLSQAAAQAWPPLPPKGFVSGRSATEEDVSAGNAVFVAKSGSHYVGAPLNIAIPQYAYLLDSTGSKTPVIVVQAERANDISLVGVRDFNGKEIVAQASDIELLGSKAPD